MPWFRSEQQAVATQQNLRGGASHPEMGATATACHGPPSQRLSYQSTGLLGVLPGRWLGPAVGGEGEGDVAGPVRRVRARAQG
eukprot:SAG31_NODE_9623_length_1249_cov_2.237391_2_plen_82_part_01